MGLEAANYISDLVDTNPTGSDPASSSDDHHRLIKKVLKQTFPNITGQMTATQGQLNGEKVRLGAGPGQAGNALSMGWNGSGKVLISLDGTNLGGLALDFQVVEAAPPGMVGHFYMNTPPSGWLKANGAAVSRATYASLFAAIGTYYGAGNGTTTFNLPNDQGLFARGWDETGSIDPSRAFGSTQASQNLSHNHGATNLGGGHTHAASTDSQGVHTHTGTAQTAGAHTHGVPQTRAAGGAGPAASLKSEDPAGTDISTGSAGDHSHTLSINSAGAHTHTVTVTAVGDHQHNIPTDGGSEARPLNRAVLVCIKY